VSEALTAMRDPLKLTYIIGTYPSLTTTFIDREIDALRQRGTDLQIISIRRPHTELSPRQLELQQGVSYLLPPRPGELVIAHLWWMVRRPMTVLRTIAYLVTRPHPFGPRRRTLLHVSTGLYAAYRLRGRADSHLHAHFADRAATVALVASRLLTTTYSVTAHANDIYLRPMLLKEKVGEATFAATCTEYNRSHLASTVGEQLAPRIMRLYHGLDLTSFRPGTDGPGPADTVVSVGQLKEKKGLRYLIEACALLRDRGRRVRCEIIGDGPLRADLQALIDDLGLGGEVSLLGALPLPEVVDHYRRSALFVLPCVVAADGDRDGIPNAILEAMGMELGVISTAVSGIPEVVRDGTTGFLVEPANAAQLADRMQELIEKPDLRRRLGHAARALVLDQFEIERNVERLMEAFAHG
jgi:colanic acid/amylovoran biosynthesis glycosyltransferase